MRKLSVNCMVNGANIRVRGSVVVEALCCKLEGCSFETQEGNFILSICLILPAKLGPGIYLASNRNEYQKQKSYGSGE
jgi:hypothetical protein